MGGGGDKWGFGKIYQRRESTGNLSLHQGRAANEISNKSCYLFPAAKKENVNSAVEIRKRERISRHELKKGTRKNSVPGLSIPEVLDARRKTL